MRMPTKTLSAVFAACALALGVAVAPPASAAVYDEVKNCQQGESVDGIWVGTCDNVWWNASPNARSARLYFGLISFGDAGSHYRNTAVAYAQSTDGSKKTYTYYCLYDNNTSSASLGTLTLGGGLPAAHDYRNQFGSAGWNPCQGYKGMIIVINGWYGSSGHIKTTVRYNAPADYYPHGAAAYECTYPSEQTNSKCT